MARLVLTNATLIVNSVDLSNHVAEVAVNRNLDVVEDTAMGASGHESLPGLRNDSFEVTWRQDFAAASVDVTLDALFAAGSVVLVKASAAGTSYSATNPSYSGSCYISEYNPIAGGVGDILNAPTTFTPVGGVIARGTS